MRSCPHCRSRSFGVNHLEGEHTSVDAGRKDYEPQSVFCRGCGMSGPEGRNKKKAQELWDALPRRGGRDKR